MGFYGIIVGFHGILWDNSRISWDFMHEISPDTWLVTTGNREDVEAFHLNIGELHGTSTLGKHEAAAIHSCFPPGPPWHPSRYQHSFASPQS